MTTFSIILIAIAWMVMMGGVCWYITIGARKGDLNFMKGLFFIASCVGIGMFLLTLSFLIS